MKVRCGFVSNSSSSSFMVYGFSSDDSNNVYNLIVEKLLKEDPTLNKDDINEDVEIYLNGYNLDYFHYDWDWEKADIGYELLEGSKDSFIHQLEKGDQVLKKFDEDHGTDFAKNAIVYCDCIVDG